VILSPFLYYYYFFCFFFFLKYYKLQTFYTVYQSSASVVRHIRDLTLPSKSSNRDVCLVLSVYTFASFTCLKRSPERGSCCHASLAAMLIFWFWFWVLCLEWPQISFVRHTTVLLWYLGYTRVYRSITQIVVNICRMRYSKSLKKTLSKWFSIFIFYLQFIISVNS